MIVCQRVVGWRVRASGARSRIVALRGSVRSRVSIGVTQPLARVGYSPSSTGVSGMPFASNAVNGVARSRGENRSVPPYPAMSWHRHQ
jgi:hypothetical protein